MRTTSLLIFGIAFIASFGVVLYGQLQPYRTDSGVALGFPFVEESYVKVPADISPSECVANRTPVASFPHRRMWNIFFTLLVATLLAGLAIVTFRTASGCWSKSVTGNVRNRGYSQQPEVTR